MHGVTRWAVVDKLTANNKLTIEELRQMYPVTDDNELLAGIKEYLENEEYYKQLL